MGGRIGVHWLVTGGCGFIGANLVADLMATPGQRVRILDDGSAGATSLAALGVDARALDIRQADVRQADAVTAAARDVDVIVHLAGATGVPGSLADPLGDATANVLGTLNVLQAARANRGRGGGARVVFASTTGPLIGQAATAQPSDAIDETTLPAPSVPYGASKLAAEGYCRAYAHAYGVPTCVLRLTNVYGPGSDHKAGAVGRFLLDGIAGRALTITGDGGQTRDFLYVGDLVRALRLAAEHPNAVGGAPGQTFQIATGRATSIAGLADAVGTLLAARGHPVPGLHHAPARPADVRHTRANPAKAAATLGWRADIGLADGLARVYAHVTRQLADPV